MRKKEWKSSVKIKIALCAILIVSVLIIVFFTENVNPVIKTIAEDQVRAMTTVAVNTAAGKIMSEQISYADIINITKDNNGDVTLIQTNSALINSIARRTVVLAQSNISSLGEQGIEVPIGSLSGIMFLSGKGPSIKIKALPVGTAESKFYSQFSEAGINQTKHTIIIEITSDVSVIMPGANATIQTVTDVVLCENIIVGKVPDTYLNSPSLDEMMNLIP